jgi:hypothetical protein
VVPDFLVARNPEQDSSLPFLIRLPLGPDGIVLKVREAWPRTAKVYCHRAVEWPADAEILERIPVRSCVRRGPAIDLVLDRGRENRSQLVVTQARGREMIFWQSPRTTKQARPNVAIPTRRATGQVLHILVDTAEKYPYAFTHQQATTARQRLNAGDYAVELDGVVVAAVERKTVTDLASSLLSGKLTYALAELTALPRAGLVVEDRYSALFKLEHTSGGQVADALAEAQARFPTVPISFAETRPLAQEWTYRFLGAALAQLSAEATTSGLEGTMTPAGPVPAAPPTPAQIRQWAHANRLTVSGKGRIPASIAEAYTRAHAPT